MNPETWDRLESVFFQALALPAQERAAFLEGECGHDPAFLEEVKAVLASHLALAGEGPFEPESGGRIGTRVGPYQLEELVGRGGMGEVYRARRADEEYEQEVAVKLIRSGLPPHELARRFRLERQILARLQHANLATLLDGGVTPEGLPYLVMEYVRGVPVTDFADQSRLPVSERLRLFVTICRAVQYAHGNLVVHRDLKPSNILVGQDGRVRLLDFGIAKLLDPEGMAGTNLPTESLLLLTPEHAAPEQFLGTGVTTATDVYQLGVLLYELLTGRRPFRADSSHGLHRAVCQEEPPRPSQAPGRGGGGDGSGVVDTVAEADAARNRGTTPDGLRRSLRGDLDRIVLMTLRKEPSRRYASAAELAEDVERHLEGYPVRARPETVGYLVGRFVRRHRWGVAAGTALAVSLIALAALSLHFAASSARQSAALARERDVAVQVSGFLEGLFSAADPWVGGGQGRDTLRVDDFLDEGARQVRAELGEQPMVQARLLGVLGRAYRNLGRGDAARSLLEEALAIRRSTSETSAADLAASRLDLALVLVDQGRHREAEQLLTESLDAEGKGAPSGGRTSAATWGVLGNALQADGRYAEAEVAYRQALELAERDPDGDAGRHAEHLSNLATALVRQARYGEAEALLREAVVRARGHWGDRHPATATMLNNLGNALREQEKLEEAEPAFREALAIRRTALPGEHPAVAVSVNNLADLLLARGELIDAEALFRESLELRVALFGEVHPAVGNAWINLGAVLQRTEARRGEALQAYERSRAVLLATLGPRHPLMGAVEGNVGRLHHDAGDHDRAAPHLRAALDVRREALDPGHPLVIGSLSDLGRCLMEMGRLTEAETVLLEAHAALDPQREEHTRLTLGVSERLARLLRMTGRHAEADLYESGPAKLGPEGTP